MTGIDHGLAIIAMDLAVVALDSHPAVHRFREASREKMKMIFLILFLNKK
jgi:hypothetical protein